LIANRDLKDTVDLFVVNTHVNDPEQLQLELVAVGDGVIYRDSNIRQISFDITGGILPSSLSAATLGGITIDIVNRCREIQLGLASSTQGHGYVQDGISCTSTASSIGQNPYKAHRLDLIVADDVLSLYQVELELQFANEAGDIKTISYSVSIVNGRDVNFVEGSK
jgi:hypothetical protein